jgi:hypothetical protein
MSFGYSYRYDSYNSLTVPLDIGTWECTLLLRSEYEQQTSWRRSSRERDASDPWRRQSSSSSWFDQDEDAGAVDQKRREDDERTFLWYFRPNYDLGSIVGQAALNDIRSFLCDWLNVAHWNLPTDNAGIGRALKQAVADGKLVPFVDRDHRNTQRTFRPTPAPLYWPQSGGSPAPRIMAYGGYVANSTSQAGQLAALESIADNAASDDGGGSGGLDWLGIAQTVAGAALRDNAVMDNSGADSYTDDASTPLGDAQPFEYSEDPSAVDVEQLAGMPFNGAPNSWASSMPGTMPQLRQYGPGGTPMTDIDFEAHHGNPNPHAHNWDGTTRDEGAPVSVLPW